MPAAGISKLNQAGWAILLEDAKCDGGDARCNHRARTHCDSDALGLRPRDYARSLL